MSRYIDADAIYDKVEANYRMSEGVQHVCEREFLNLICDAPTVDAVQVVRCGECYYKDEKKRIMDEDALWCRKHHMYVTADWFCADGDRK